eukprot:gene5436-9249_t
MPIFGVERIQFKSILNPKSYFKTLNLYKELLRTANKLKNKEEIKIEIRQKFRMNKRVKHVEKVNLNIKKGEEGLRKLIDLVLQQNEN